MVYDENGQPLTASYMDYLLPTAAEVPSVQLGHLCTPSPRNAEGFKGLGEGGMYPSLGALANAVEDALAPLGARVTALPLSPARVRALVDAAAAPLG
jgi:carbon-monoxide dehydrogenase large subunit